MLFFARRGRERHSLPEELVDEEWDVEPRVNEVASFDFDDEDCL